MDDFSTLIGNWPGRCALRYERDYKDVIANRSAEIIEARDGVAMIICRPSRLRGRARAYTSCQHHLRLVVPAHLDRATCTA